MATYGNSGNRWWVGLNVGSDQSTIFGTGSILSPNGYESLPSGNSFDDSKFAAAAGYNAAHGHKPNTISVENVSWFNIRGPYPNQGAANAAIPAIQKANPAPGAVQQITAGGQKNAAQGGGINPTKGISSVEDFLSGLTSANLWIRVAKVSIGGVLILIAVSKMTGAGSIVSKIPVPIPV